MIVLFFKWLFDLIINHRYKLLCDMYNYKYRKELNEFKNYTDCTKTLDWVNSLPKNEVIYFEGLKTRCETLLLIQTK